MAKPDNECGEEFRNDHFSAMPSAFGAFLSTRRLTESEHGGWKVRQGNNQMIGAAFQDYERRTHLMSRQKPCAGHRLSCFDNFGTKKEDEIHAYKDFKGYSPLFAYLAAEGWLVNALIKEE